MEQLWPQDLLLPPHKHNLYGHPKDGLFKLGGGSPQSGGDTEEGTRPDKHQVCPRSGLGKAPDETHERALLG